MKAPLLGALILGLLLVHTDHGSAQATGTPSELADDALGGALWRIAIASQTRIGFESVEFVRSGSLASFPPFPASSPYEALTAALAANPRYEAKTIGEFVVVRPKSAWSDAADPFNRSVHSLRVENEADSGVVLGVRDFIYTNRFAVNPKGAGRPVTVNVQSGTVIDLLNQLAQSADAVFWNASYRPHAQPDQRFPHWDLATGAAKRDRHAGPERELRGQSLRAKALTPGLKTRPTSGVD